MVYQLPHSMYELLYYHSWPIARSRKSFCRNLMIVVAVGNVGIVGVVAVVVVAAIIPVVMVQGGNPERSKELIPDNLQVSGRLPGPKWCHPEASLTPLACHPTKKVNKAEELTYLSTNIVSLSLCLSHPVIKYDHKWRHTHWRLYSYHLRS